MAYCDVFSGTKGGMKGRKKEGGRKKEERKKERRRGGLGWSVVYMK